MLPTVYSLTAEVLPTTILAYVTYFTGYCTKVLSQQVKYKMVCFKKRMKMQTCSFTNRIENLILSGSTTQISKLQRLVSFITMHIQYNLLVLVG